MSQDRIMIGSSASSLQDIYQPDEDLSYNLETTYSSDSTRTQDGAGHFTPLFTVESYEYKATNIPVGDASEILRLVVGKQFYLHAFNPYYGVWKTTLCYVGKGTMTIKTLKNNHETLSELSFNMISVGTL